MSRIWTLVVLLVAGLGAGAVGYWLGREPQQPAQAPSVPAEAPPVLVFERREAPTPKTYEVELSAAPTGSQWSAVNRDAIAALDAGELERAVELFQQCAGGDPEQAIFRHNLAEALVRLALREHERVRPCAECIPWLERALELAPDREPVKRLLERWRVEAETEKGFYKEGSQHFDISYDGGRDALTADTPAILVLLEGHWTDLALLFGAYPGQDPTKRIPVVLYRPEEFRAITGLGHWAGGAFDGAIRVPMEDGRGLDARLSELLRHELVHVFVREAGGAAVPGWLNEGLAQWLQGHQAEAVKEARERLKTGELLPLERLQGSLSKLGSDADIERAYAQALALCDHIAQQYGEVALMRMVAGCKDAISAAQSFHSWTTVELALAFSDFAQSLR